MAARGNELVSVSDQGEVETLWHSGLMVHEPRLIAARPRETVIPTRTDPSQSTGTLLVHGLHLDDAERARLAASGAWLAACVESNQNNAVGAFHRAGLDPARILLGTDGLHGDMLRSARAGNVGYHLASSRSGAGDDGKSDAEQEAT